LGCRRAEHLMRGLAIGVVVGGLLVGIGFAGIPAAMGLPIPNGLLAVSIGFALVGPLIGGILLVMDRHQRRLAREGLRRCPGCGQTIAERASQCGECGRTFAAQDPLTRAVARARIGSDERQPCPACGKQVNLDRVFDAPKTVPGQHRCERCGSLRHE
jgi:DNA-directed RNA polymerase subunit RPC12/RpoP